MVVHSPAVVSVLTLGHLVRKVPAEIDLCRDELAISDGMHLAIAECLPTVRATLVDEARSPSSIW